MKPHRTICFALTVFSLASLTIARADVVLQPPGLNPGDPYRLVFVTSTRRDGHSSEIADYNQFVQQAADNSPLAALQQTWRAIASDYAGTDAYTNTFPVGGEGTTGIPIYRVDARLVATGFVDLWDGAILLPIALDEHGGTALSIVWTGTGIDGHEDDSLDGEWATYGISSSTNKNWINRDVARLRCDDDCVPDGGPRLLPFYAISGVITAVPEPSTYALAIIGMASVGGVATSRGRSKNSCPSA